MKSKLISIVAVNALMCFSLIAATPTQNKRNTNNDIDNSYKDKYEKGFYYYQDPEKLEEAERQPNSPSDIQNTQKANQQYDNGSKVPKGVEALLAELLKEARKQTKLQTEIRDILKEQFAPEPKVITRPDGSKCIENSSADCFVMPVVPEARRVPAIANWLKNPSIENTKNYLQWYSRYLSQIFDIGNSLQLTIAQYGTEAYPMGFQRGTFDSATGAYEVIKNKHRLKLLSKYPDIGFEIYLGDNIDLDIFSMDNIALIMSELPKNKFTLIFKDNASYKIFNEGVKTFKAFAKAVKNGNVSSKVDPQAFKNNKIQTTPTYSVIFVKDGQRRSVPFITGRVSIEDFTTSAIRALEYEKRLKRTENVDYETWKDAGNYAQEYLEHFYGLKLNKEKIKGFYNGK